MRSWFRTFRIDRGEITGIRSTAYSGFANLFSDSRIVSMVSVEVANRALPVELRFLADVPSRVRERAPNGCAGRWRAGTRADPAG